jgi:hypothetical protein
MRSLLLECDNKCAEPDGLNRFERSFAVSGYQCPREKGQESLHYLEEIDDKNL